MSDARFKRREILKLTGLASLAMLLTPTISAFNLKDQMLQRKIPGSNQLLPVVGLGTWQTFDVGLSENEKEVLTQVLVEMNKYGGKLIDSSPMYGQAEAVVGALTHGVEFENALFYATKVWTNGKVAGINQMNASFDLMKRKQMDLMQIHNLVDWKTHVKTLKNWKENGKIKYWGITHYTNAAHADLEKVIKAEQPDFVQFNYSINSRHAENSLFQTVKENGTAVIVIPIRL